MIHGPSSGLLSRRGLRGAVSAALLSAGAASAGPWAGFVDMSTPLRTDTYSFVGSNPEALGNENYYDGDFADFDGDGLPDRLLGARYGLLQNTGGGLMQTFAGRTGFLFRGMSGASGWGEDAFQWLDADNDGDFDILSGGNSEPLVLQQNRAGRFSVKWNKTGAGTSTIHIGLTDIERDGDVDFLVTDTAFTRTMGLWVNDGSGAFTREDTTRGFSSIFGKTLEGAVSGDVDGDGDFDLIINSSEDRVVGTVKKFYLARNDGTGHFTLSSFNFATPATGNWAGTSAFFQSMNLGDLDGDGDLDLVMACADAALGSHPGVSNVIFINTDGQGTFVEQSALRWQIGTFNVVSRYPSGKIGGRTGKLWDIDYDGDLDFISFSKLYGQFAVFMNDGSGVFTYDDPHSPSIPANSAGTGEDLDITDIDRNGTYDVWLGTATAKVNIYFNTYLDPTGLPADVPRQLAVEAATTAGIRLAWRAPPFASTMRSYRVYRSTAAGLEARDRQLIKHIALSRHGDETFTAPITQHTTTAYLNDPDVTLDGATQTIRFTDTSARPGIRYFYTVSHVGTENCESAQTPEVAGTIAAAAGADTTAPQLVIQSPTAQSWQAYPRIVLQFADGQSGIDAGSLVVSFNRALGSIAAGTNLKAQAQRSDDGVWLAALRPPLALPSGSAATLSVSIADNAGNVATSQVAFTVQGALTSPPTASFTAGPATSGSAPLTVSFDASASTDNNRIFSFEWYFGDGTTSTGRQVVHTYAAGSYSATLLVRDNEGAVATAIRQITVTGSAAQCTAGQTRPCYSGPQGTAGTGVCAAGTESCTAGLWGSCQGEVIPNPELCDGADNDCDGATDEAWPQKGTACTAGAGVCASSGSFTCSSNQTGVTCSAPVIAPATEVCEGQADEDCDGTVDNGCSCSASEQRACYGGALGTQGVGACRAGVATCVNGLWSACDGQVLPMAEDCSDGIDSDCDGSADGPECFAGDAGPGGDGGEVSPPVNGPGNVVGSCGCAQGDLTNALWVLAAIAMRPWRRSSRRARARTPSR